MWALDFAFFVFKVFVADVILGLAFGMMWAALTLRQRHDAQPRKPIVVFTDGPPQEPKSDAEHVEDLLDKL